MVACDGFNMNGTKTYFSLPLHMCSPIGMVSRKGKNAPIATSYFCGYLI
jgi:hypothetical protein